MIHTAQIPGRGGTALSESKLKFPEWQIPFQELLQESDREGLRVQLQRVETLVFERLQYLSRQGDPEHETEVIREALQTLREIKRDRLNFPDWRDSAESDSIQRSTDSR